MVNVVARAELTRSHGGSRRSAARCYTSKCSGGGGGGVSLLAAMGIRGDLLGVPRPPRHIDSNRNYFRAIIVQPPAPPRPPVDMSPQRSRLRNRDRVVFLNRNPDNMTTTSFPSPFPRASFRRQKVFERKSILFSYRRLNRVSLWSAISIWTWSGAYPRTREDGINWRCSELRDRRGEPLRKRTRRYSSGVDAAFLQCEFLQARQTTSAKERLLRIYLLGNNDLIVSSVTMNYLRSRMETSLLPRYACDMCKFKYYTDAAKEAYKIILPSIW